MKSKAQSICRIDPNCVFKRQIRRAMSSREPWPKRKDRGGPLMGDLFRLTRSPRRTWRCQR